MFTTTLMLEAETAYRQERIKRDFRASARERRRARATKPEARHPRRSLRPTPAA
ncbi:hypothetical protein FB561_0701 [Kribbella amoyensis]|uniref:Uncharacterized protein n=1 Tax=Kribbella amoyensis TaxID=996641 RepID=A0A561BLC7_9ACTN|nr:hypothetical protein [Kribbella amoyensis]TWD79637.1 hypothetical protein FB561_0701 [Kribbella amoyensis]